jgi:hypothetical protein
MQIKEMSENSEDDALIYNSSPSRGHSPIRSRRNTSSPKHSFAKLGCTFFLFGCVSYIIIHGGSVNETNYLTHEGSVRNEPFGNKATAAPIFLFGHSTGHSGTGTFHQSILEPGCPWNITIDKFEYMVEGEGKWGYDEGCELVKAQLIPHLFDVRKGEDGQVAYVDMGKIYYIFIFIS